jgi:hypothetical protein
MTRHGRQARIGAKIQSEEIFTEGNQESKGRNL